MAPPGVQPTPPGGPSSTTLPADFADSTSRPRTGATTSRTTGLPDWPSSCATVSIWASARIQEIWSPSIRRTLCIGLLTTSGRGDWRARTAWRRRTEAGTDDRGLGAVAHAELVEDAGHV